MALNEPVALVLAHYRSTWNQIARDAGLGGKVVTVVMLVIVGLVMILPGLMAVNLGFSMGGELAQPADAGVLRNWNLLQVTFTLGFALLGSFRFKPAFPFTRFGRYPITPLQLLLADLPASLFEVFPLLGAGATVCLSIGLSLRMPRLSLLILLLMFDGVVAMLATMIIVAALWASLARHRRVAIAFVASMVVASYAHGLHGLKESLLALAQAMPISRGFAGVVALRSGRVSAGLGGIAIATVSAIALFAAAAQIHGRRLMAEVESDGSRSGSERMLDFSSPASGIGRLFLRQLLGGAVRVQLFLPLLFTGPVAMITAFIHGGRAAGKTMPEDLVRLVARGDTVMWFAIVPVLAVAMNPQIWMNQFGWDRGGLRTMLLLPLEPRDLLAGKLRGLIAFTAIQTTIAVLPLFAMRRPALGEVMIGLASGGLALIVTTAVGHLLSIRFPRRIDGVAGLQIPLHLSWISPVLLLVTITGLIGVHALGELVAKGAGAIALILTLAAAVAVYIAILPELGKALRANRDHLLAM